MIMLSWIRALLSKPEPADTPDALWAAACSLLEPHMILDGRPRTTLSKRARSDVQKSIALFERVLQHVPTSWSAHWMIGKAHQALGNREASRNAFDAAWKLNRDGTDAGRELSIAHMDLSEFDAAVEVTRELVINHPGDPGLVANFALALLMAGDVKNAKLRIEEALRASPDDRVTQVLASRIEDVASGKRPQPRTVAELTRR